MSKILYTYLPNDHDFLVSEVNDDYQLQINETFVAPVGTDGTGIKLPVTFDGAKWIEATDDEHKAYSATNTDSNAPTEPSDADKAVAALTLQLAQNKADQDAVNAQLLLATAQQTTKETN